jgi:hypothetical protein
MFCLSVASRGFAKPGVEHVVGVQMLITGLNTNSFVEMLLLLKNVLML